MIVNSTEVQNNFGKYLKLLDREDIIITRNGKKVARLIGFKENEDYVIREGSSAYSHKGMKVSYEKFLEITRESENRFEYIDGEIYLLASPRFKHQKIVIEMSSILLEWFKSKKCQPLSAPFDVTLYKDEEPNVVQPDLLVICDQENVEEDDTYSGIPALVVEVLSQSTQNKDVIKKLDLYRAAGVCEYWIINPLSKEINIYQFAEKEINNIVTFKKNEVAKSFVFSGLEIMVDDVLTPFDPLIN